MARMDSLFPDDIKPAASKKGSSAGSVATKVAQAGPQAGKARVFVSELKAGQEVQQIFLVQESTLRLAKNGSKYIQATLSDKTGNIPVRQWDARDEDFERYAQGSYVQARGRVETYQNKLQMIAVAATPVDASTVSAADFLPVSARDPKVMIREFEELLKSIKDPDYSALLNSIFGEAEVRNAFYRSPAALTLHHAWVGGLLEHVLSASATAHVFAEQRPFLNRDLLVAGVILHDIGKIHELDSGPGFPYTDTGRLCGHIALGVLLVERHILSIKDFPERKRALILHLILSHHGSLEFGSPVIPCTAEAVALHHIECMDAKVQGFQTLREKHEESGNQDLWTEFSRMAEGRIFLG